MAYLEAEWGIFEIKLGDFSVFYRVQSYRPVTELELQHRAWVVGHRSLVSLVFVVTITLREAREICTVDFCFADVHEVESAVTDLCQGNDLHHDRWARQGALLEAADIVGESGAMNHRICEVRHEELNLDLLYYFVHIGGRVQVVLLDHPGVALREPVLQTSGDEWHLSPGLPREAGNTHTSSTEGLG